MSRHAHAPTHYELDPQLATDTQPLASLALSELRLMDIAATVNPATSIVRAAG